MLKNLLIFVDSNTDLLRRVWAPWPARGNEHEASLLKTLICYHLTSFIDLTELIIILDEILNIIALLSSSRRAHDCFRGLSPGLDSYLGQEWQEQYPCILQNPDRNFTPFKQSLFSRICIIWMGLILYVIFGGIINYNIDLILVNYVIFFALVLSQVSIFGTEHFIDLVKFARLL